MLIRREQLEDYAAAGRLRVGRVNARSRWCCFCGARMLPGTVRDVQLDGRSIGVWVCGDCARKEGL